LTSVSEEIRMRGAFNTPDLLARFLVNWAIRDSADKTIDPSCGDGIFLEEAAERLLFFGAQDSSISQSLAGVEIDHTTAAKAKKRLLDRFGIEPNIVSKGFFSVLPSLQAESFDVVMGNPPFVRNRNFYKPEMEQALKFLKQEGFTSSKLMNAWLPFLVAGVTLLKPKGRLAMVVPAELLQVSYAADLREHLLNKFGFVLVITFNKLVFPEVEQEIILLMGTKGEGRGLRLIEIEDLTELDKIPRIRVPQIPVQNSKEKWTQYFLNDDQRIALRKALAHQHITKLGNLCEVDVGVVTGMNDFFILSPKVADELDAKDHLVPVVTRTKYLKGITFTKNDWETGIQKGIPSYLLDIKPILGISKSLRTYISKGEKAGIHKHFKCRIREPWYVVPSIWMPDAFLFRQIGSFPKMICNLSKATCTDTLHRVKFKDKRQAKTVSMSFYNSLTFAFSEIFGRSYGGGVLELMPTEAEKLPVPVPDNLPSDLMSEVDGTVREGLHEQAMDIVDKRILQEELGFRKEDILLFRSAWADLSKRRKTRKKLLLDNG